MRDSRCFPRGGVNQFLGGSVTGGDQCSPILRRDAIPLSPRTYRGNGFVGQATDDLNASVSDNVAVGPHDALMHNALSERKRLLRNRLDYAQCMDDPASRLRIARLRAGYGTAKDAAEALGFPVSTYLGHENGSRGISAKRAVVYARKYKVREQWLLYGVGQGPGDAKGEETAEIVDIVERLPSIRRAEALRILRVLSGE